MPATDGVFTNMMLCLPSTDDVYTVYTEDADGAFKDRVIIYPTGRLLDFRLQACKTAYIHLVETPYSTSSEGYRSA